MYECKPLLLGHEVSAQLIFEGRGEKVASPHEHRSFEVTEPTSELRILLLCEGRGPLSSASLGFRVYGLGFTV